MGRKGRGVFSRDSPTMGMSAGVLAAGAALDIVKFAAASTITECGE